jgi:metal-dependent amidase/aminoacylase/carboxypeptidase family protein
MGHDQMVRTARRIETMVAAVAAGYGCNVTVDWRQEEQPYYPPTVNDGAAAAFVRRVAEALLGDDAVRGGWAGGRQQGKGAACNVCCATWRHAPR